jgi:hypothetical protein
LKDIDNIEDWYREELNNYSVEPDKNGWNALSEDLDTNTPLTVNTISDWYKKEVSKLEERPDYTVWEKIATQLDTTSVWDQLAISLSRYDQLIWWRNAAIRGTAIFLLSFGSYLAYDNYFDSDNNLALYKPTIIEKKNNQSIENSILDINIDRNNEINKSLNNSSDKVNGRVDNSKNKSYSAKFLSNNQTTIVITEASSEEEIRQSVRIAKSKLTSNKTGSSNRKNEDRKDLYASKEMISKSTSISVKSLESLKLNNSRTIVTEINRHQLTERDISHLMKDGEYLVKKDKNKIVFNSKRFSSYSMFGVYTRRFYAGFNLGVKKQGMITSLKKDSPLADYQQNSLLDFGNSFGGTVGFILSDNINIEANINLNSTSGYKRAFDAEEISFQENLNLDYTTINLLAKKMNNKSTFDNKVYSTNFIGGVYASYLRSAVSDINGTTRDLDEYNKTDYGIVLGIEQDRYISKTLVITPGIRYNQGLANIVNSDSSFDSSRNFSLEFNLGVKYIFLKKGK